jgi:hypothetical protein
MTGLSDRGDARAGSGRPAVRRLAWVVAGSVVIGPLAAVVLTAGVFAGAPEHVVTGTGLLGLALAAELRCAVTVPATSATTAEERADQLRRALTQPGLHLIDAVLSRGR